jgi:hypothetical protein
MVMAIIAVAEGDDKAGVSNGFHCRENPLRVERSGAPAIFPA